MTQTFLITPPTLLNKGNIVLKAGQKVLVLKSPKGVYMQLESGKIVAIKTAIKVRGKAEDNDPNKLPRAVLPPAVKNNTSPSVVPQKRAVKPFSPGPAKLNVRSVRQPVPNLISRIQSITKKLPADKSKYRIGSEIAKALISGDGAGQTQGMMSSDEDSSGNERRMLHELMEGEAGMELVGGGESAGRRGAQGRGRGRFGGSFAGGKQAMRRGSVLDRLEQSTSAIMSEGSQPFQVSFGRFFLIRRGIESGEVFFCRGGTDC